MRRKLFTLENFGKAVRQPNRALDELIYRTLSPFGQHNYHKFLVLTRSRTGSNLLIQALNSHPKIASEYEIFGLLGGESEQEILGRCFGKQPFFIEAKGFKIFYYHPQDVEESPIWDQLQAMRDLRVIHLKRRNYLRAEISSRIAYTTGVYGVRSDTEFKKYKQVLQPVLFQPDELARLFQKNQEWELEGEKRFADHDRIELLYEDLASNFEREYRRVLEFLGIDFHPPRVDFKKQSAKNMREQVSNYQELKSAFTGTRWEHFFED